MKKEIRRAVADLLAADGCDCCRNVDAFDDAKKELAKLLSVPKYSDGSGYDFSKFRTKIKVKR